MNRKKQQIKSCCDNKMDFRGEVKVLLHNLSAEPFTVTKGMRIAQLVVNAVPTAEFDVVEELPATERGTGGFGSTGH